MMITTYYIMITTYVCYSLYSLHVCNLIQYSIHMHNIISYCLYIYCIYVYVYIYILQCIVYYIPHKRISAQSFAKGSHFETVQLRPLPCQSALTRLFAPVNVTKSSQNINASPMLYPLHRLQCQNHDPVLWYICGIWI